MSFWGNGKWTQAHTVTPLVIPFRDGRLEDGCYRLAMGSEAIISSSEPTKKGEFCVVDDTHPITLEPGQFAYLITEERVELPANTIGFINVSTELKIKGLVNISGFHVDPLYKGKLIFTVFNAGPSNISIGFMDRIFRLWLSEFSPDSTNVEQKTSYDAIPKSWADRLHGVYPSPFALASKVDGLERDIKRIDGQKRLIGGAILAATVFFFPFAAALYAETFGPYFHEGLKAWSDSRHPKVEVKPAASTPATTEAPAR